MLTNLTRPLPAPGVKPAAVFLLLASVLLQSCYSYQAVTDEEQRQIADRGEGQIQITLADGREVIVEPYHYVRVPEPTDGVYAAGELLRGPDENGRPFHGIVQPVRVDSNEVLVKRLLVPETKKVYYDLWLPDSSRVRCEKNDLIRLSKEEGAGLWVNGYIVTKAVLGLKETTPYVGKVPESDAHRFERKQLSWTRTAATTMAIGTVMALTIILYPHIKTSN